MNEPKPWRKSPFTNGNIYRVKKEFESLRDSFKEGETLKFDYDCYSIHHSMTGYVFLEVDGTHKVWDIGDDEDLNSWRELFEWVSN